MADFNQINQFGSVKPARFGEGTSCAECEAMLMDALDHEKTGDVLSPRDKAAFDLHIATCAECSQMLADARRGASLLEMLKSPRPEPSSALLEKIIAQTSGFSASSKSTASGVIALPSLDGASVEIHGVIPSPFGPVIPPATGNIIPFRPRRASRFSFSAITRTMMQPRLAMTAAMAFFSITLTLNLTGVHITELKAADLTPANLKHTFFHANASVVRYYENLRVVYELESRVNELKQSSGDDETRPAAKPSSASDSTDKNQTKPRKTPKSGSGTSERRGLEDRRSPLNPQFKLVSDLQSPSLVIPEGNLCFHSREVRVQDARVQGARVPHPSRLCTSQRVGSRTPARPQDKLKESLQEGDLV